MQYEHIKSYMRIFLCMVFVCLVFDVFACLFDMFFQCFDGFLLGLLSHGFFTEMASWRAANEIFREAEKAFNQTTS